VLAVFAVICVAVAATKWKQKKDATTLANQSSEFVQGITITQADIIHENPMMSEMQPATELPVSEANTNANNPTLEETFAVSPDGDVVHDNPMTSQSA
jgi:hypothetical protein